MLLNVGIRNVKPLQRLIKCRLEGLSRQHQSLNDHRLTHHLDLLKGSPKNTTYSL